MIDEPHSVKEDEASSKVVLLEKNKSQDADEALGMVTIEKRMLDELLP